MRCDEIQLRVRSRVLQTKGGNALTFGFLLGPISVFVIANIPEDLKSKNGALAYIKLQLRLENNWEATEIDD